MPRSLSHARQTDPCAAEPLYVPYPWEGHQAGDSGPEGVACSWVQVPASGPEASGEAGCGSAEIWGGDNGQRVFLAWT